MVIIIKKQSCCFEAISDLVPGSGILEIETISMCKYDTNSISPYEGFFQANTHALLYIFTSLDIKVLKLTWISFILMFEVKSTSETKLCCNSVLLSGATEKQSVMFRKAQLACLCSQGGRKAHCLSPINYCNISQSWMSVSSCMREGVESAVLRVCYATPWRCMSSSLKRCQWHGGSTWQPNPKNK